MLSSKIIQITNVREDVGERGLLHTIAEGLPTWLSGTEPACQSMQEMQETWVRYVGQEDPLEKGMATHSSILAWKITWTEEPGRLQFKGSQRVGLK